MGAVGAGVNAAAERRPQSPLRPWRFGKRAKHTGCDRGFGMLGVQTVRDAAWDPALIQEPTAWRAFGTVA